MNLQRIAKALAPKPRLKKKTKKRGSRSDRPDSAPPVIQRPNGQEPYSTPRTPGPQ